MTTRLLIHGLVQQTTVLIAHLATASGGRSPLGHVANHVFADLTRELAAQGLAKHVIADMFGMALRTYHRKVAMCSESLTDSERSVWEAVLEHIREKGPVSGRDVHKRFRSDDTQIVTGVLADLTNSGLTYRTGRGDAAVYRIVDAADFEHGDNRSKVVVSYLVWLAIYRLGPVDSVQLAESVALETTACDAVATQLVDDGRATVQDINGVPHYSSETFEVDVAESDGRDAAILDHFQSLVAALCVKLRNPEAEATGGATYNLDVFSGHPLEAEARETISNWRASLSDLRARIDLHNATVDSSPTESREVVVYLGQYVKNGDTMEDKS